MAITLKDLLERQKQLELDRAKFMEDPERATVELATTLKSASGMMNQLLQAGIAKKTILEAPDVKGALEAFSTGKPSRKSRAANDSFSKGKNGYKVLVAIADGKFHDIKKLYTDLELGKIPSDPLKGVSHIGKVVAKNYATVNDEKAAIKITGEGKEAIKAADAAAT